MKNDVQRGDKLEFVNAGGAIASGDVVQVGVLAGIAEVDIAATTGVGTVLVRGVVEVKKRTADVMAQGDLVEWDISLAEAVPDADVLGDFDLGHVWEAAGNGAVLVKVRLLEP